METFIKCLFAVTALSVVLGIVSLVLLELSWRKPKKQKPFKISKEVDYILSRGVFMIDRTNPNK